MRKSNRWGALLCAVAASTLCLSTIGGDKVRGVASTSGISITPARPATTCIEVVCPHCGQHFFVNVPVQQVSVEPDWAIAQRLVQEDLARRDATALERQRINNDRAAIDIERQKANDRREEARPAGVERLPNGARVFTPEGTVPPKSDPQE